MKKKPLNEGSIAGFIGKFFEDLQNGTQKRFIKQAQKRGVPNEVLNKMTNLEKEYVELTNLLRKL